MELKKNDKDVNKMFKNYIGQDHIKKVLSTLINYSKESREPLQHMLITGSSGNGKSFLVNEIAKEFGVKCTSLLATSMSENDLIKAICDSSDCDLIFLDECLSGDTEVLTESGYTRLDELTANTRVAQWNDGNIEFVYPSRIVKKYAHKVYELPILDNMTLYQTEHHRNIVFDRQVKKLKVKYPNQLTGSQSIICAGKVKDEGKKLTLLEKLIIMTQADGAVNGKNKAGIPVTFSIALSKKRKVKYLHTLIKEDKENLYKFREVIGRKANRNIKALKRWLYNLPKTTKSYKLLSNWFNLNNFDLSKANDFLDNIFVWDAADYDYGKVYCTTEKANAEFVYQVMVLAGYTPHISKQIDRRGYKTHYRVYMSRRIRKLSLQHIHETRKLINWNDYMYCITVPSTFFVARKDGYTFITGNCHSLSKKATEILFPIMAEGILYARYKGAMRRFKVSKFTIIGATDRPGLLNPALLNRFQLSLNLKPYTTEEFSQLIRLHMKGFDISDDMCIKVSALCKDVPRILINIVNSIKIYLKSIGKTKLEEQDLATVREFLGVDELGLDTTDLIMLKYLFNNAFASLQTLASVCGCLTTNIENLHEPYLIKLGFVTKDMRGRRLTQAGWDYVVAKGLNK